MSDVHANYSHDWCTTPDWLAWAAETMGAIDLDPCADISQSYGDTLRYYGPGSGYDGLVDDWRGRVYCNPPGANSSRSVKPWWAKAMTEIEAERCTSLVWCFFNCEAVFSVEPSPLDLPGWLTMPKPRVRYLMNGKLGTAPRNRTWFWSTCYPAATPPVTSWIVETGPANVQSLASEIAKARGAE